MGRKKISLVINNNHKSMFKQGNYQAWWDTAIMLALIMKKQEDIEFKADLDYIVRSRFNNKKKKSKIHIIMLVYLVQYISQKGRSIFELRIQCTFQISYFLQDLGPTVYLSQP
jgi:hypothetical protein